MEILWCVYTENQLLHKGYMDRMPSLQHSHLLQVFPFLQGGLFPSCQSVQKRATIAIHSNMGKAKKILSKTEMRNRRATEVEGIAALIEDTFDDMRREKLFSISDLRDCCRQDTFGVHPIEQSGNGLRLDTGMVSLYIDDELRPLQSLGCLRHSLRPVL